MVEERSKRALPARHSFLTEAVSSVLEAQSKLQTPQVDSRTILKLDQDITDCIIHGEANPPPPPSSDTQPVFRILPLRRPIKTKSSTAFSDDYYTSRHRKHEMEEKKQKNREKERLEHELYQQQQLVERLKTLDKSTLASIVSSLRNGLSIDNQPLSSSYTSMTTSELERLHQTILQDAREQMYRYEQLGLGRKRGQGFATHHHRPKENIVTPLPLPPPPPPLPSLQQPHSPPPSPPSSSTSSSSLSSYSKQVTTTTSSLSSPQQTKATSSLDEPNTQNEAIVLAHLKTHRQPSTGGKRKSLRTAIAFGEKIPAMDDMEFTLPENLFGDLMRKRTTMATSRRRRLA